VPSLAVSSSMWSPSASLCRRKRRQSKGLHWVPRGIASQSGKIIEYLASQAEQRAGYRPNEIGWLSWFDGVVRGESLLLQKLRHAATSWHPLEKAIFDFYFVDRLTLADIGLRVRCDEGVFHTHLLSIQRRIRGAVVFEVMCELKQRRARVSNAAA
jgi:hypothetical protein